MNSRTAAGTGWIATVEQISYPPSMPSTPTRLPVVLQMDPMECGAACLTMLLRAHGHHALLEEVADAAGISRDGASIRTLRQAAEGYGLEARSHFVRTLGALGETPLPLIAHWNVNHFVVIERLGPDGCHIVDPALGRRVVDDAELDRSLTGAVLSVTPGPAFQLRPPGVGPLRVLLELARPQWAAGGLLLGLSAVVSVLGLAMPVASQALVDEVLVGGRHDLLAPIGLVLAGVLVLAAGMGLVREWLSLRIDRAFEATLMHRMVAHLVRLPAGFFLRRSAGLLVGRMETVRGLRVLMSHELIGLFLGAVTVLAYGVAMLVYDPTLAGLVFAIGALRVLVYHRGRGRVWEALQRQVHQDVGLIDGYVLLVTHALRLKGSGQESSALRRWSDLVAAHLNAAIDAIDRTDLITVLGRGVAGLGPIAVLTWGGLAVLEGAMSLGTLLAFFALQGAFMAPLEALVTNLLALDRVPAEYAQLHDVLGREADRGRAPTPEMAAGAVSLSGVSYRFGLHAPWVLQDVSLDISPGQHLAIVGPSGAGKSTLVRLVAGLLEPTEGSVRVGGPCGGARGRPTSAVLQRTDLFSMSVHDNIALGHPGASRAEVVAAAEAARVHGVISALPEGYDTLLSGAHAPLSGGERQRVALARALVAEPSVLVLDEATSAMDALTEAAIFEALDARHGTRVTVSHRVGTLVRADLVLVLEEGKVSATGTHATLSRDCALYQTLLAAERQGDGGDAGAEAPTLEPMALVSSRSPVLATDGQGVARCLAQACAWLGVTADVEARIGALGEQPTFEALCRVSRGLGVRARGVSLERGDHRFCDRPVLGRDARGAPLLVRSVGRDVVEVYRPGVGLDRCSGAAVLAEAPQVWCELARDMDHGVTDGVLRRTFDVFKAHRRAWSGTLGLSLASELLSLMWPWMLWVMVEMALPHADRRLLLVVAGLLTLCVLVRTVVDRALRRSVLHVTTRTEQALTEQLAARTLKQPLRFFERTPLGALLQRFDSLQELSELATPQTAAALLEVAFGAVALAGLALLDGPLALVVLLAALFHGGVVWGLFGRFDRQSREHIVLEEAQRGAFLELVRGVLTLKALGATGRLARAWTARFDAMLAVDFRLLRDSMSAQVACQTVRMASQMAVLWLGASRVVDGAMSLGTLFAFLAMMGLFLGAVGRVLGLSLRAAHIRGHFDRVESTFRAPPEQPDGLDASFELGGHIRAEGLCFRYGPGGPLAVADVSLEVQPGSLVALVGPTGSGKSTLAKLLVGLYPSAAGSVAWDGRDLQELDVQELRRQCGVVMQSTALPDGLSVRQALTLGCFEATLDDVKRAARLADIAETIESLPMGYDTGLSGGGEVFSGGQRQRLALASALVSRPSILVLDEATSEVDNISLEAITHSLDGLGCTRIVVAHRLFTVRDADEILVMDGGRVVERGRHADLMAAGGLYARLVSEQLSEEAAACG